MGRKELPYFNIGRSYGGSQRWFADPSMFIGGCGALTMCDLMIYMAVCKGRRECVPFRNASPSGLDYVRFGMAMKPYLRPRNRGIDSLQIFIDGAQRYLDDHKIKGLTMEPFSGFEEYSKAEQVLKEQIDRGMPVPMLMLNHTNPEFSFFEWHWFLIVGYEYRPAEGFYAKAATYGKAHWLRFDQFWDTGEEERGGLIVVRDGVSV